MENHFSEIKLFQVKADKIEPFEAMIGQMFAYQKTCEGCCSIRYMKRFYTIDGVRPGEAPRELTKILNISNKSEQVRDRVRLSKKRGSGFI